VSRPSLTGILNAPWVAWDEYDPVAKVTQVYYAFEANAQTTQPFWLKRGGFHGATTTVNADATSPSITSVDYRCGGAACGHAAFLTFNEVAPGGSDIPLVRISDGGNVTSIVNASRHVTNSAGAPNVTTVNNVPYVTWSHDGRMYVMDCGRLDGSGNCLSAGFSQPATIGTGDDLDVPHLANVGGLLYMTWIQTVNGVPQVMVARRDDASPHFTLFGSINRNRGLPAANSSIASVNGVPVVAWQERNAVRGGIDKIYVDYFDGTQWRPYGSELNVSGRSGDLPDITAVGATPYVAFYDVKSSSVIELHVKANFFHVQPFMTTLAVASTRRGRVFSVGLGRKAKVRLAFLRTVPCRVKRVGCTRKRQVGSVTFNGHKGTNRFRFTGLIGGQKLGRGTYTVTATAISGRKSGLPVSVTVRF
jgi:hypothetical protein